jgi:energy-coupling factor transport system ATP-binding protein
LKGVDLSVDDGEYLFIGGANGSGKSTLGYLFNGLVPHYFGGTLQGSVSVDGVSTLEQSVSELFDHVGFVFQNADAQLFNSTVEDEIAFGLESLGLPAGEIDNRIRQIVRTLKLEDFLGRSPVTLSGGEKRLVAVASVLCLNPSVLLLDEPYGDLDWEAVKRVRQTLLQINQSGKAVVVIEQRMGGFLQDTSRCLILDQGKLLHEGTPQTTHDVLHKEHLLPSYLEPRRTEPPSKDPVLTTRDLSFRVEKKEILNGISLEVRQGEILALIGRNGSGKTTLLKHFNGLLRPTAGKVTFQGEELGDKAPSEMAVHVGLSFQNPNDQFFKYRVKDEILVGPKMLGKVERNWLQEICNAFGLHELLDRSPYRLSEGEKKRVALASILAMQPQIFVLDEPTSGQDGPFREALAILLVELRNRGFTIVVATHDLGFAKAVADRWIVLHEGRVVADGPPENLWDDERLVQLGALPPPEAGN